MDGLQVTALAVLQRLTEFLPISSSAHLVLLPQWAGWTDQGLAFDVAVHAGSLLAVLIYFRRDLTVLLRHWVQSLQPGAPATPESRLVWAIGFGTIPVGLAGLFLGHLVETALRTPFVIACTTIGFGVLLGVADKMRRNRSLQQGLNWTDVLLIGVAQALAVIPGVSRSGVTITAGLMLGLQRRDAARFSFLLAIPVICLASGLKTAELAAAQTAPTEWLALLLGVLFSALSAYLCIRIFLRFLEQIGMAPFVLYRLLLGAMLLYQFPPH